MKNKTIKIINLMLVIILTLFMCSTVSNAASFSASISSTSVDINDTITVTVNANNAAGNYKVSASNSNVTLASGSTEEFIENTSTAVTFKAVSAGTVIITAEATDMTDLDDSSKAVTGSQSFTVTINDPTPASQPDPQPDPAPQPDPEPTPEPKQEISFDEASGTVYTTVNELNFRSTSDGSVIGSIDKAGTELEVTGRASGKVRVKYNGKVGYVSADYVSSEKPEEKTEEKSNNANLKTLSIEGVSLSPEFKADVVNYKAEIGKDVKELNVIAEAEDEKAKVDIRGNKDLKVGENKVAVSVSAEDGTIKIYEITVTKKDEVVLGLKSLKIKDTNMFNQFKTDKYSYELNVQDVDKLEIEAVATIDTAKIEILGNENLQDGENTITIMVKSESGDKTVTYQIKVNKNVATDDTETTGSNQLDSRVYLYGGICVLATVILIALIVYLIRNKMKNQDEFEDDRNDLYNYENEDDKKREYRNQFLNGFNNNDNDNDYSNDFEEEKFEEQPEVKNEQEEVNDDFDSDKPRRGKGKHF